MISINESKFDFKMIGISPEINEDGSHQKEFECSLEDFLIENKNGFFITLDEMYQAIMNAKEDVPIYEVSDKILVFKRRK